MISQINNDCFEGYICGQYFTDNSGCYMILFFFSLFIFYLDFNQLTKM